MYTKDFFQTGFILLCLPASLLVERLVGMLACHEKRILPAKLVATKKHDYEIAFSLSAQQ